MPIYSLECTNEECKNEWDDLLQLNEALPNCPKCNSKEVKKVIALTAKGRVELYGNDLKQHIRSEGNKLKKEIHKDENKYANMVGEDKFQKLIK